VPAHLDVAYLQLALGRDSAAHATLDAMRRIQPRAVDLEARAFALLLPLRTPSVSQLEDVRARMRDAVGQSDYSAQNVYTLGLIALGLGDTAAALAHASEIDRLGGAHYHGWAETLRAGVAYRSGRLDETVRRIAAAPLRQWFGWASTSPHNSSSTARWLRAEALRELGRDDAALGWYASFAEHATHDLALLAPSHLRRAEIHERRGEAAEAARHYARVIELWHDADPSLQPVVAFARERLAALGAEAR